MCYLIPVISDFIQEMDDRLITGYNKLITSFQKFEFHNLRCV